MSRHSDDTSPGAAWTLWGRFHPSAKERVWGVLALSPRQSTLPSLTRRELEEKEGKKYLLSFSKGGTPQLGIASQAQRAE
jgi:hypothetical protein